MFTLCSLLVRRRVFRGWRRLLACAGEAHLCGRKPAAGEGALDSPLGRSGGGARRRRSGSSGGGGGAEGAESGD